MPVQVWVMGGVAILFAGVIAYVMTRRYGWGAALSVPVLALIAIIAMRWQDEGLTVVQGLDLAGTTLLYAAPVLLGFIAGMAVARIRRG